MDKREKFLRAVDRLERIEESNPWTAEPWPDWFKNVVLRMTRVFIPDFKKSDFKNNRERFEGFAVAFIAGLTAAAEKIDLTKFPAGPLFDAVKKELQSICQFEPGLIRATLRAASDLPTKHHREFFAAYADGLERGNADYGIARLGDSQTAQICLFLIFARPSIDNRQVPNVTVLLNGFMKIREAFPGQKEFFEANPGARASLAQHFRKICTTDGIKLARRGQPKRIRTSKA